MTSAEHVFAREVDPIDPIRLEGETFIFREPGSGSREVVVEALKANRVNPIRRLDVGSTEAIKQLVASGVGIAITSVATIRDQLALGTLIAVPIRNMRFERTLWRLSVPGRLANQAIIAFERLMQI
ncbi:LysR substrate-binding domain-containing protein [Methylobacterium sp. NEAU K]|uniref:LysR substrate-binding domain-containing protein n=1 Tax=Methylobacterium sp. NEAU K TaxID=3064946 RepID=UPI00351F20C6